MQNDEQSKTQNELKSFNKEYFHVCCVGFFLILFFCTPTFNEYIQL